LPIGVQPFKPRWQLTRAAKELDLGRRERRRTGFGGGRVGDGDVNDQLWRRLFGRPDKHVCELDHSPSDIKVDLGRAEKDRESPCQHCLWPGPFKSDSRDDGHDALAHHSRPANFLLQSFDLGLELVVLGFRHLFDRGAFDELLERLVVRHTDGAGCDEEDERLAEATGDVSADEAGRVAGGNGEVVVGKLGFAGRAIGEEEAVEGSEADRDIVALAEVGKATGRASIVKRGLPEFQMRRTGCRKGSDGYRAG
jgi:hypothetical protein